MDVHSTWRPKWFPVESMAKAAMYGAQVNKSRSTQNRQLPAKLIETINERFEPLSIHVYLFQFPPTHTGIMLHVLLTGRLPFLGSGKRLQEIISRGRIVVSFPSVSVFSHHCFIFVCRNHRCSLCVIVTEPETFRTAIE